MVDLETILGRIGILTPRRKRLRAIVNEIINGEEPPTALKAKVIAQFNKEKGQPGQGSASTGESSVDEGQRGGEVFHNGQQ